MKMNPDVLRMVTAIAEMCEGERLCDSTMALCASLLTLMSEAPEGPTRTLVEMALTRLIAVINTADNTAQKPGEIETVWERPGIGRVTSDGIVFQAWREPNRWKATRIGGVFGTFDDARDAVLAVYADEYVKKQ